MSENPLQQYFESPKTLIIREILPLLRDFQLDRRMLGRFGKIAWIMLIMMIFNVIMDQYLDFFKYILQWYRPLLYQTIEFNSDHVMEQYIIKALQNLSAHELTQLGVTLLNPKTIQINRLWSCWILTSLRSHAQQIKQKELENLKAQQIDVSVLVGRKLSMMPPKSLFPSWNHQKIYREIKFFFDISDRTRNFTTLPILCCGPPGLGKTCLISYLAQCKVAHDIRYVEMNLFPTRNYEDIFEQIIPNNFTQNTVVMVDELDKYLQFYITEEFQKQSKKKDFDITWEDFSRMERHNFLVKLNEYIGHSGVSGSLVLIFCSNNFEEIYRDVDMTHFMSLKDRLKVFDFKMCVKDEIIEYFTYYHQKCQDMTEVYVEPKEIKQIMSETLHDETQILYRQLFFISLEHRYHPKESAEAINQWYQTFLKQSQATISQKPIKSFKSRTRHPLDYKFHWITDPQLIESVRTWGSNLSNIIEKNQQNLPSLAVKYKDDDGIVCKKILLSKLNSLEDFEYVVKHGLTDIPIPFHMGYCGVLEETTEFITFTLTAMGEFWDIPEKIRSKHHFLISASEVYNSNIDSFPFNVEIIPYHGFGIYNYRLLKGKKIGSGSPDEFTPFVEKYLSNERSSDDYTRNMIEFILHIYNSGRGQGWPALTNDQLQDLDQFYRDYKHMYEFSCRTNIKELLKRASGSIKYYHSNRH